jgi:hypothetical protein
MSNFSFWEKDLATIKSKDKTSKLLIVFRLSNIIVIEKFLFNSTTFFYSPLSPFAHELLQKTQQ